MPEIRTKEELVERFRIDSIQEAALRVIARKGLSAASMQEIADEAGIAKGTLYLYFESQRDLLAKTLEQAFSRLADELIVALEGEGSYLARLERQFRAKSEFLTSNAGLLRLYTAAMYPGGADATQTRCSRGENPHFQRYIRRLESFLGEAMAAGEIRAMRADRLALLLEEGFMAVLLARLTEMSPPPIDEEISWLMEMLREGIAIQRSRA
jgi:TetR/AcrR family fatty acid metabolism transcriptional regulator